MSILLIVISVAILIHLLSCFFIIFIFQHVDANTENIIRFANINLIEISNGNKEMRDNALKDILNMKSYEFTEREDKIVKFFKKYFYFGLSRMALNVLELAFYNNKNTVEYAKSTGEFFYQCREDGNIDKIDVEKLLLPTL